ncbi:MAG: hypothetical protein FJ275_08200, partial [Planctomycetes bacterium]|nr:hypothetical protein [Planctomycetota bacterium]
MFKTSPTFLGPTADRMESDPLADSDTPPDPPAEDGDAGSPPLPESGAGADGAGVSRDSAGGRLIDLPIEQELKDSYLTYAMSV